MTSTTGNGAARSTGRKKFTAFSSAPTALPCPSTTKPPDGAGVRKSRKQFPRHRARSRRWRCFTPTTATGPSSFRNTPRSMTTSVLLKSYYRALRQISQSVDVVSAYAPLDGYKLVAAPSLNVLPKDLADHLLEYVRNGGHLVLGPRSGMKDEFNALLPQRQPGFLVDALGARVEQYYALEKDFPVSGAWGNGEASIWAEQLKSQAPGDEVLLKYGKSNGWLDDQPAVITRAYGKGRITYVGAVLDDKLMAAAAEWMTQRIRRYARVRPGARWRRGQPSSRSGEASLRSHQLRAGKPPSELCRIR